MEMFCCCRTELPASFFRASKRWDEHYVKVGRNATGTEREKQKKKETSRKNNRVENTADYGVLIRPYSSVFYLPASCWNLLLQFQHTGRSLETSRRQSLLRHGT